MSEVFIIAECGINHNGNLEIAKQQIDLATACGVNAVKFQVYNTDLLYNYNSNAPYYWDSKRSELSHGQFRILADYSPIEWFASCFDEGGVELLEAIGVKRYKVASRSLTDHKLLKEIARTKKPVIMSTGGHSFTQIEEALRILSPCEVTLLYCVTNYPTKIEDLDFGRMIKLGKEFNLPYGFSDHTTGIWASIEAVRLGAKVIEKHFTVSRTLGGCDQICSLEPHEMKLLVKSIRQYERYKRKI